MKLSIIIPVCNERDTIVEILKKIESINEIQKQIKGMPGQEKMIFDYYQKNPSASQSLKGSLYEEKIIELIKSKINLTSKEINTTEAEKIIAEFNKPNVDTKALSNTSTAKNKSKTKKISKK